MPPKPQGVAVDVARDQVRIPISVDRVKEIVRAVCAKERVRNAMISVTFVSDRTMARMNSKFLGHRGPTDIITFELNPMDGVIMGDIYIAPGVARKNAQEHGVGVREELVRLVVHGTLHVLGYTHPEDDHRTTSPMWRKQEKLVAALG
jgi:probable rRNA maturation factor